MGYLTRYRLSVKDEKALCRGKDPEFTRFIVLIEQFHRRGDFLLEFDENDSIDFDITLGKFYALCCRSRDGDEPCRWYLHEQNMCAFSKRFPTLVFVLEGKGDDEEDRWIKYFKDGRIQVCRAQVVYEDYDEAKLVVR